MNHLSWLKRVMFVWLMSSAIPALALGGYLSFLPPSNIPSSLDELDFYFQMIVNPGPKAFMYYAHNFAFNAGNQGGQQLTGYIGPQSNGGNDNARRTLVIATVWYDKEDRLVAYNSGPDSSCQPEHNGPESQGGWLIQCRVNDKSEIAQADMPNGTTYKISIKRTAANSSKETYEFAIQDLVTGKKTVLGSMTFSNIAGINPQWPSHFLENFGGNFNCQNVPYLAYTEKGPAGIRLGTSYAYTVHPNPAGPFDCNAHVSFSANYDAGTVVRNSQKKWRSQRSI